MIKKLALSVVLLTYSISATAGQGDDFKSCYSIMGGDILSKPASDELFVLIDHTIELDNRMKGKVRKKILDFIDSGKKISIITFSTYNDDHYTKRLVEGQLDFPLTEEERNATGKTVLKKFDHCLVKQEKHGRALIDKALVEGLAGQNKDIPNSEILINLQRIAESMIANSEVPNKRILIVSDMIENSDIMSFYSSGKVALDTPNESIGKLKQADVIADFSKSDVYVFGAGHGAKGYKRGGQMRKLNNFWKTYFTQSNASLKGWGQPELFEKIK